MTDPTAIEREIEEDRAGLQRSLSALDARLSPEHLVDQATQALRGNGGDAMLQKAQENPVALALIGTGLVWLIAGNSREPSPEKPTGTASYDPRIRPTSPGLAADGAPTMAGFDARVTRADRAMTGSTHEGENDMTTSAHTFESADTTRDNGSRSDRLKGRVTKSAAALRERINDGMESMPEAARARILDARLKAIDAQAAVEARTRRAAASVKRNAQDNPLMLGLVALGLGAAVGAALPRTATENRAVGAHRDRLFDDAERTFREETAKLRRVAEAAVAEGKSAVKDTLRDGPPTEDNPAARVRDAATDEAKKQKLGQVS